VILNFELRWHPVVNADLMSATNGFNAIPEVLQLAQQFNPLATNRKRHKRIIVALLPFLKEAKPNPPCLVK
jgi:hypothetical protein